MSLLMVHEQMDFNTLKKNLKVSDGNLASHLNTLEKNEYISVHKSFVGKKPQTIYKTSDSGKKAFVAHLDALEQIIKGIEE